MADINYSNTVDAGYPANGAGFVSIINWLGAILSVALIAGLAWWGYQLMVRDVTGVPVVRALEGPMRIAPEDPGGQAALHQGLAVNNISGAGTAEDPADRVVLAPKPAVLTDEDETTAVLEALQVETAIAPSQDLGLAEITENIAVAEEVAQEDLASGIEAALLQATGAPEDLVSASSGGVSRSRVPLVRPDIVLASLNVQPTSSAAGGLKSINARDIPTGTRLAQLGAFETEAVARQQWDAISIRFDDFMSDKAQVIQKAQSGGKVFYRLRAHGFDDLSDARRFCSALMAGQANCIPVVTR